MTLAKSFRLSLYLMLGLSSAALGSASDFFLPEIPFITAFSLVLLAAAYFLEDRFALSLSAANLLGGILTACLVLWFAFQFVRKDPGLLDAMPFPASLLPYLAPALMVLMPAKMLRPKHVGDYWTMFALGLMSMALACTMASDLSFAFFMVAWLILFVRSLALFFLCREFAGTGPPAPDSRWVLVGKSARWVAGFGAVAFGVFLLTPRPAGNAWALTVKSSGRIEVGLNSDSPVDLNRTGSLSMISEKAFDIYATGADDRPKNDLSPTQRWRGSVLANYSEGKWLRGAYTGGATVTLQHFSRVDTASVSAQPNRRVAFPHLSDDQYYVRFVPASRTGGTVLADPVFFRPREAAPAAIITEAGFLYFHQFHDGYLEPPTGFRRAPYLQAVRAAGPADLGPPLELTWHQETSLLLKVPPEVSAALRPWTLARVDELIAAGAVPGVKRREDSPPGRLSEKQQEAIARGLDRWLATSPDYAYTTELTRSDRRIDPTVDFLLNVKSGHCERYATGLALMLRSIDIPCQVVMGYKGCDFLEDGHYEIRSDMAHAWVEVLIRRPQAGAAAAAPKRENPFGRGAEDGADSQAVHYWLTLDPSPGTEQGEEAQAGSGWFNGFRNRTERFFQDYIVGYNTDLRGRISKSLTERAERAADEIAGGGWVWLLTGGGSFLIGLAAIRRAKNRALRSRSKPVRNQPGVQFHDRLLSVLKRHGFEPRPDQTPREFASEVGAALRPVLGELAGLPTEAAELFYRSRYGESAIGVTELNLFEGRLVGFENGLATNLRK